MKTDLKIAAVDSSGLVASVAVVCNGTIVADYSIQYKKTHSQTLLPMLDEICRMTQLELSSLDAIAIASGPGSFTGLRIGSATAKGLGMVLDIPLIEIPTLDGLAYNMYGVSANVCPILDARRGQVYAGIYRFAGTGDSPENRYLMEQLCPQCAAPMEEIADKLNELGQEVIFLGDGVPVFEAELRKIMRVPYHFAPAHMNRQRAASLAALGSIYFRDGKTVSAAEHVPVYLRLSQAERERQQKEEGAK